MQFTNIRARLSFAVLIGFAARAEDARPVRGVDDAVSAFSSFHALVAKSNGGVVTLPTLIDSMNAKDGDPKSLVRLKAWDKNGDGRISPEEGSAGLRTDMADFVEEQMKSDADGDGALSIAEYALAVPDAQGEKTPSGLTKRQEIMFRSADANKDEKYSREEAIASQAYRQYHSYRGRAVAYRARVLDANRDGRYDSTELAALYGVKSSDGADNQTYDKVMMRIIHMPLTEMEALEKRLMLDGEAADPYSGTMQAFLRLFDTLDTDRDGKVPLPVVFDALQMEKAEARQVKSIRGWDVNADGIVTRSEAEAGVRSQLVYQTDRGINTDADGDGALTPEEYALSYPDPNGKADESGVTAAQRKAFQQDDLDRDGKVTRREIEMRVDQGYRTSYVAQWIALRAKAADKDGDGMLNETEFAAISGAGSVEASLALFAKAGAKNGRLSPRGLYLWYFRATPSERQAVEKQLENLTR